MKLSHGRIAKAIKRGDLETLRSMPGLDVNLRLADRQHGDTLLTYAATHRQAAVAQWLTERGADVDSVRTAKKASALIIASCRGTLDVVRVLLDAGANINQRCALGSTPLIAASSQGQQDVVQLLLG